MDFITIIITIIILLIFIGIISECTEISYYNLHVRKNKLRREHSERCLKYYKLRHKNI